MPAAADGYTVATCVVANDGLLLFLFAEPTPMSSGDDGTATALSPADGQTGPGAPSD